MIVAGEFSVQKNFVPKAHFVLIFIIVLELYILLIFVIVLFLKRKFAIVQNFHQLWIGRSGKTDKTGK